MNLDGYDMNFEYDMKNTKKIPLPRSVSELI